MTRMNLNTFARHGVFESREMVEHGRQAVCAVLSWWSRARVLPYQLLVAYA